MAGYITVQNARDAGVTPAMGDDPVVQAAIGRWSDFIDEECRQWFESRNLTVLVDGNGTDIIFLPVPIISVSALYINDGLTTAISTDDYVIYSGVEMPDDRRNPRIRLKPTTSIFGSTSIVTPPRFVRGRQNQKIVGAFGYLNKDSETPSLIQQVCLKLVIREFRNPANYSGSSGSSGGSSSGPVGPIASETTDRHTIRYATPQITGMRMGSLSITGDPWIDAILTRFKGPKPIAVSSSVVFQAGTT